MAKPKTKTLTAEDRAERILQRLIAAAEARDNLLAFARFMRPSPADIDDVNLTTWQTAKHHRAIADALHKIEDGSIKKLILTMQPRAGKTTLSTHLFVPWYLGRHPEQSIVVASYNDTFAADHGRKVRDLMLSPAYRQIFPDVDLRDVSTATVKGLVTPQGGEVFFVGRGSATTGRGGNILIADDLLSNAAEAASPTIRDGIWAWWNQVFRSRAMDDQAAIVLCMTRWHADDPPGRLIDPKNDHYSPEEAKLWHILSLPALAMKNDPLGRKLGEPLWPERFSKEFLERERAAIGPLAFESTYQGSPTVASGNLVNEGWLKSYEPGELPALDQMRIFIGTDFALSARSTQSRDHTVIIPAGLDDTGTLWILPNVTWTQINSEKIVETLISYIKQYKPDHLSGEKGLIAKSIGPFLRRKMMEEGVFTNIFEYATTADKQSRFQGMVARLALGKVRFPTTCPWWSDARAQMLAFPNAAHDDFVDAMSSLGIALDKLAPIRSAAAAKPSSLILPGTLAWLKADARKQDYDRRRDD